MDKLSTQTIQTDRTVIEDINHRRCECGAMSGLQATYSPQRVVTWPVTYKTSLHLSTSQPGIQNAVAPIIIIIIQVVHEVHDKMHK